MFFAVLVSLLQLPNAGGDRRPFRQVIASAV
jgi:hypothetical protein